MKRLGFTFRVNVAVSFFIGGLTVTINFVVCGEGVYVGLTAYNWQKIWAVWLFGYIAVLFNPSYR